MDYTVHVPIVTVKEITVKADSPEAALEQVYEKKEQTDFDRVEEVETFSDWDNAFIFDSNGVHWGPSKIFKFLDKMEVDEKEKMNAIIG